MHSPDDSEDDSDEQNDARKPCSTENGSTTAVGKPRSSLAIRGARGDASSSKTCSKSSTSDTSSSCSSSRSSGSSSSSSKGRSGSSKSGKSGQKSSGCGSVRLVSPQVSTSVASSHPCKPKVVLADARQSRRGRTSAAVPRGIHALATERSGTLMTSASTRLGSAQSRQSERSIGSFGSTTRRPNDAIGDSARTYVGDASVDFACEPLVGGCGVDTAPTRCEGRMRNGEPAASSAGVFGGAIDCVGMDEIELRTLQPPRREDSSANVEANLAGTFEQELLEVVGPRRRLPVQAATTAAAAERAVSPERHHSDSCDDDEDSDPELTRRIKRMHQDVWSHAAQYDSCSNDDGAIARRRRVRAMRVFKFSHGR
eukprot:TRINITY_DN38344_c0_g2_i1.p1 TRINITY_DN38344_c0_g2~~TRINITY_DN38344_c0_g2_i1.p1  ORF type:complete len:370 (+),score=61.05 TRINITY_DN38344_c0_g2_i1:2-1111(+)